MSDDLKCLIQDVIDYLDPSESLGLNNTSKKASQLRRYAQNLLLFGIDGTPALVLLMDRFGELYPVIGDYRLSLAIKQDQLIRYYTTHTLDVLSKAATLEGTRDELAKRGYALMTRGSNKTIEWGGSEE